MGTNLVGWVDEQLQRETLPDEVALLVLAALDGDEQLDEYLADGTTATRIPPRETPTETGGVVLRSITVEGFRGIGPSTTLTIPPGPGLTVVAGRNGSGKSSFSEALELVLTGDTYRWSAKATEWRDQWRNLHHPRAASSSNWWKRVSAHSPSPPVGATPSRPSGPTESPVRSRAESDKTA